MPTRPAADSRVNRAPWRAYRASTTTSTIVDRIVLIVVKRS